MPESGMNLSEGTALPTRIPPLRLGSSANDPTPKWNDAALACAGHSPPGRKGPVLLLVREPPRLRRGRRIPKRYVGAGGRCGLRAQLFEPHARAGGAGRGVSATSRYFPPRSVSPGGGRVATRRAAPPPPRALCMCVSVCVRACCACINDPSAGSPTETLLRLLLPVESLAFFPPPSDGPAGQSRALPGRAAVRGPHKASDW